MTTQLCFDAGAIVGWLTARRAEGLALPVEIGVPGVAPVHRLLAISARIGVRDTGRFLSKNVGLVGRIVRSGGFYRPDGLLRGLAPAAADPAHADRHAPPVHVQPGRDDGGLAAAIPGRLGQVAPPESGSRGPWPAAPIEEPGARAPGLGPAGGAGPSGGPSGDGSAVAVLGRPPAFEGRDVVVAPPPPCLEVSRCPTRS